MQNGRAWGGAISHATPMELAEIGRINARPAELADLSTAGFVPVNVVHGMNRAFSPGPRVTRAM